MRHNTPKRSSIEKALEILMAFIPDNNEMGTVGLSQNLDLHPATVNRILQILSQKGFLQQNDRTRKFTLGPSAFQLGRTIFQSVSGNLLKFAMPYLGDLSEKLGETVVLEVMSGKNSVVVYLAQGTRGYLIGPKIGDRVPMHAAAGAKAMLAFYDRESLDSLLDGEFRRFTSKTITDLEALQLELKKARKQGVAFCREEMARGVNAIGAPIFDHDSKAVAAVVVVGQASRLKCDIRSPVVEALKGAVSEISARIFHPESMTSRS